METRIHPRAYKECGELVKGYCTACGFQDSATAPAGDDMHKYRIVFKDGRELFDSAKKIIDIIRKYDLATRENIGVKVYQL